MKKFYLIRHAQSESNAALVIRENHLINITDTGRQQAKDLADYLQNLDVLIDGILVSPYIRTQQTAQPYLDLHPEQASKLQILPSLHEINIFEYEQIKNLSFDQIRILARQFWQEKNDYKAGDDADSFDSFFQRVQDARRCFEQLPDGNYLVFTHGMWIGMLIWQLLHQDGPRCQDKQAFIQYEHTIRPNNCDVYLLTMDQHIQSIAKLRQVLGSDPSLQTM